MAVHFELNFYLEDLDDGNEEGPFANLNSDELDQIGYGRHCTRWGVRLMKDLPRGRKRLTELFLKASRESRDASTDSDSHLVKWRLEFLRSPLEVVADESGKKVAKVRFGLNYLEEEDGGVRVLPTGEEEFVECGLVLQSIGYKILQLDPMFPFDQVKGVIKNSKGRVEDTKGVKADVQGRWISLADVFVMQLGSAYWVFSLQQLVIEEIVRWVLWRSVLQWLGEEGVGVILSSPNDSMETAKTILDDIASGHIERKTRAEDHLINIVKSRGTKPVTFQDWLNIDEERIRGESESKPREKIADIKEMLQVAFKAKKD